MEEKIIIGFASILALGLAAQWIAWRLRLPSVLMLMVFAFVAGPVLGVLQPDEMFGELLLPLVSISVGLVLFEAGLSLRLHEVRETAPVVTRLVTVGAGVTWALIAVAAYYIVDLPWNVAILLGALLTVTGPTVIIPMLRSLRLAGRPASVVKWEGIIIDPLMVICAVLVFEAMIAGATAEATVAVLRGVFMTILLGGLFGALGAGLIYVLLRYHLVPDFLHIGLTLAVFAVVFTVPNHFQHESGLAAVTLMGVVLANQKTVSVRHIVEFKENVRTILIAALFVVLTARLTIEDFVQGGMMSLYFTAVLIVLVRPIAAFVATTGSRLNWREKSFLAWMAPRGIVAASLSSIFAERLADAGFEGAEEMVPLTIVVVALTVAVYGLTAPVVALRLRLSQADPQGLVIMGAHEWGRKIAAAVKEAGFKVYMADTNWKNISRARMEDIPSFYGSILDEDVEQHMDISAAGKFLAMTRNDEANALAAVHMSEQFGRVNVFQLAPLSSTKGERERKVPTHMRGRVLWGNDLTFEKIEAFFREGAIIKTTLLTPEFGFKDFKQQYGEWGIPLFLITENNRLQIFATDNPPAPRPGQTLVSLIRAGAEPTGTGGRAQRRSEKDKSPTKE